MCGQNCVYCLRPMTATRTTADGDATEYRCEPCGYSHVLKASAPGDAFEFFPDDIEAMVSNDIKPLFPQTGKR